MNAFVQNAALFHDPDFDAPAECPVIMGTANPAKANKPFSWMALLNQIPARPAFFLGFGLAVMIVTMLGFLITLSILWNA